MAIRGEGSECVCWSIVVYGCRCLSGNYPNLDTKVLSRRRRRVQQALRSCVFPHWAGAAPECWSCFTEPWGGVGRVPGVQCFVGALLYPWDDPVEGQALCNWALGRGNPIEH